MTEFVLSSRNRGKIAEMEALLSEYLKKPFRLLSLDDIGYHGETEENGSTFEENSLIKARVPNLFGYIGIADDSGLVVDALGGAPGIYSARYSGEGANSESNNAKLLRELAAYENEAERSARFICAVSCAFPDGRGLTFTGSCEGIILKAPRGSGGFGYDPLFYYQPFGKTFGELSSEEKNAVSHRSAAMKKFAVGLSEII